MTAVDERRRAIDAMVLLYARKVWPIDPSTAEWIVMLNSSWLD